MSYLPNAIEARDLLANVINDLTTGEAIFPDSAEAIARCASDALDGVRDLESAIAESERKRAALADALASVMDSWAAFDASDETHAQARRALADNGGAK